MTTQVLKRSFGKVAGLLAIAFAASVASAYGQQVQQGADGCFYTTLVNQFIPPGQPG